MNQNLGALEEIILMIVLREGESYGAELVKLYIKELKRDITLPAVVMVLKRLQKKGFLSSRVGEPTSERGGRRKVIYRATELGHSTIEELMVIKNSLWNAIPKSQ